MKWDNVLTLPLWVFIVWPFAALVPAGLFGAGFAWKRRPWPLVAAILWALYAAYEWLMKVRVLCSGECNIRVDLLVLYPALWIVSIVALVQLARKAPSRGAA